MKNKQLIPMRFYYLHNTELPPNTYKRRYDYTPIIDEFLKRGYECAKICLCDYTTDCNNFRRRLQQICEKRFPYIKVSKRDDSVYLINTRRIAQ